MTAQETANLRSARALAISAAGLDVKVEQTPSLPYEDRAKYLTELSRLILAYPARFAPEVVDSARRAAEKNYEPLTKYSVGEMVSDFVAEAGAQAQAINPLSEENRAKTRNVIIGAILAAAVAYFGVLAWRTSPRRSD